MEAEKLTAMTEGVKAFKLYRNLLSDEARQPWEKVILTKCPWEDVHGVTHDETPTKTWDSFMECVTLHLQQVFRYDTGEALKYYIMNTLRKPNRIPICQFLGRIKQLNSYLETLPCLYYSPSANPATKQVLPLDDANLAGCSRSDIQLGVPLEITPRRIWTHHRVHQRHPQYSCRCHFTTGLWTRSRRQVNYDDFCPMLVSLYLWPRRKHITIRIHTGLHEPGDDEDTIYPLTTREIAEAQKHNIELNTMADKHGYTTQLVKNTTVPVKMAKWSFQQAYKNVQ